ncbi:MAG TPA: threonine synthase, partial [Actinomycetota bacterium]|nr:threonine synthase [Actinomycetota bacterium]
MKHVTGLRCRECGAAAPVAPHSACDECFGPLEVDYDYDAIAAGTSREEIARGPRTIWRYAALLPAPEGGRVDIGAGWTPLRRAPRLAAELGLR